MKTEQKQIMREPQAANTCPACGKPFAIMTAGTGWEVWCGYGPCTSEQGDVGVVRKLLEIAIKDLTAAIEAEMERAET